MQKKDKDKILLIWASICTSHSTVESIYLQLLKQEEPIKVQTANYKLPHNKQLILGGMTTWPALLLSSTLAQKFPCLTCDQHDEADVQMCAHTILNSVLIILKSEEPEVEGKITFLDVKIHILEDEDTKTTVYRNATHTDQYVNGLLHHPLEHKRSPLGSLLNRADNITQVVEDNQREKTIYSMSWRLTTMNHGW